MTYFVITAVAPLRSEPRHQSEMISQLLFGELAARLEEKGDFVRIRCLYDQYEGWCQRKQLALLNGGTYPFDTRVVSGTYTMANVNGTMARLSPGSICAVGENLGPVRIGPYTVSFENLPKVPETDGPKGGLVKSTGMQFLGTPYLWGGKSLYGIDCSGLVQTVYKVAGIALPRDSGPQSQQGSVVNLLQEAQAGDLAFFDNEEGQIVHVGVLLGPESILHASASVRVDPIDNYGIVQAQEGDRTHRLRIIKRIF